MKTKNFKYILAAGLVCCGLTTTFSSCGDVLDEQPRSQFDPTHSTLICAISMAMVTT